MNEQTSAQKAVSVRRLLPVGLAVSDEEILGTARWLGDRWEVGAFRSYVAQVLTDKWGQP